MFIVVYHLEFIRVICNKIFCFSLISPLLQKSLVTKRPTEWGL